MIPWRVRTAWAHFWVHLGGLGILGRTAFWLASLSMPPYKGRRGLADVGRIGFISPYAKLHGTNLYFGPHIYLDDDVVIYQGWGSGTICLSEKVHILRGTIIESGLGGSMTIGARTCIQPRCQFSLYISPVYIGEDVQIAPYCSFYPYNHSVEKGLPIKKQPLRSKGGIFIEDDVLLGVGATILDGVRIGHGAVIAAGAVVTRDLPPGCIAAGVPARIISMRKDHLGTTGG